MSAEKQYKNTVELQKLEKFPFTIVAHQKKGKCQVCRCQNEGERGNRFCSRHYSMLWRFRNPEKDIYLNLKNNSKRRGKLFTLSFSEFLEFLKKNPEYLTKRGRKVRSLTIDRIDNEKGYTAENIRAITLSENAKKGQKGEVDPECPF